MNDIGLGLVGGISVGVVIGVVLGIFGFLCMRKQRRVPDLERAISSQRVGAVPVGVGGTALLSESSVAPDSLPRLSSEWNGMNHWLEGLRRKDVVSPFGIPKFSYKEIRKATSGFTTAIGHGASGNIYKAQMVTGETLAVKVLAANSREGEKDFLSEVLLLERVHHRNLVNLVGYGIEKGHHMLFYVYMGNGSLDSHLYGEMHGDTGLSWDLRVNIALDIARGLEYLHDGAIPSIVHRDVKSSNILLDKSMRARVADFGLSREEMVSPHSRTIRGTCGYVDPEYLSTRTFTKKSDIYSFGVLLFELISGRNPGQGLMEYVELAATSTEDKFGWEEIADARLDGKFDAQELNNIAAVAYKCANHPSSERPSMRDVLHELCQIITQRDKRKEQNLLISSDTEDEGFIELDLLEMHDSPSVEIPGYQFICKGR